VQARRGCVWGALAARAAEQPIGLLARGHRLSDGLSVAAATTEAAAAAEAGAGAGPENEAATATQAAGLLARQQTERF